MPKFKFNTSKNHSFPKTENDWVAFINELHRNGLEERKSNEMQWARNIAYYLGFQHLYYDETLNLIRLRNEDDEAYIINRIAPFVEQRKAKITKSRPIMGVTPDDISPVTIKGAELSEKLLRYLWKINDKEDKIDTLALYMVLMGSGFIKTSWNSYGGEPMLNDQDDEGNLTFREDGSAKKNLMWTGDIDTSIKSNFEILVAPGVKNDVHSSPWVIERSHRPLIELKDIWEDLDEKKIAKSNNDMTRFEKFISKLGFTFLSDAGYNRAEKTSQEIDDLDIALVKEFWMKPNKIYPEGVKACLVGDQLVQFDEMPYDHKEYPFVKVDEHKNPCGFYGISTVTRMIPIQQRYNTGRTNMTTNESFMANVKYWAPKGCGLSEDSITDLPGEILETNPNMPKPEQLGVAPLPNYVSLNQQQDITDLRDVSNEREASQLPFPGLTASVALETAAEMSEIGLKPTIKYLERGLVRSSRQELMLANQYYKDQRKLKVFGRTQPDVAVIIFDNEDLQHQTDVTIQVESGLANTKASNRQALIDMWDRRIVQDPEDFLQAYVTGDMDVLMRKKDPVDNIIIADIEDIKEGKMPPISQFDNHVQWIKKLTAFIQSPEFRRLAEDRQAIAVQVLQQHLQFLQPQQPMGMENPAAVNTPFGSQVPEGMGAEQQPPMA